MSAFSPNRSLARPRQSVVNRGTNTASSPSLNSAFNASRSQALARKSSLASLTQTTLSTIPDASEGYGLSTVLDEDSHKMGSMPPSTPGRGAEDDELEVGDFVDVPGGMHGTVKFIGSIPGKKGTFAGVELSAEFATKGKNNGDVEGRSYFKTFVAGAGIFLPLNRATRRGSPSSYEGSFPLTPSTPSFAGGLKVAGHSVYGGTPPTPSVPKFSQSVGPGRATSPQYKLSRPSLQRPESPLRKPQIGLRPSIGTPKPPGRYASPAPNRFGQSVRGTQDSRDPSKKPGFTPRNGFKASVGPRSSSALGNIPMNYSDDDNAPVGVSKPANNGNFGSVSSFNAKLRPASRANDRANDEELDRLRGQIEDRDRQLRDQASSLAEMESSLNEVQTLMGSSDAGSSRRDRGSMEDKDVSQLRVMLREKNEKIAMLTAEFDAHRADFRSTIDTLELASTETERVYEKRVEDLVQEVRELQDRSEDVDSVAQQLKQLEELVQELEEGLEDARRGEAEARGEVEFLRGEVERTRSELRREREKAAAALTNGTVNGDAGTHSRDIEQRDDEIRGLKAIIHSLSRDAVSDNGSLALDPEKTPTHQRTGHQINELDSVQDRLAREKLEQEVKELRASLDSKATREEDLERELEKLRRSSISNPLNHRASAMSTGTVTQEQSSVRDSKGTNISWRDRDRGNTLETMPESDTYSSANESFCELCETSGHDILTCTNMFTPNGHGSGSPRTGKDVVKEGLKGFSPKPSSSEFKPAPLVPSNRSTPVRIIPNPMEMGPVAGKESEVVDMDKWCGVCEREGHDSIDCPFEDAF